ncbi:hypothetical protein, partial [Streptomyces sp. IB2014 016-6]|uniref:hypothetical protein n=1 Tax=Streptomyces sp. IB2014 016-6 TaxID=2517818 RepID=UPI0019D5135F
MPHDAGCSGGIRHQLAAKAQLALIAAMQAWRGHACASSVGMILEEPDDQDNDRAQRDSGHL